MSGGDFNFGAMPGISNHGTNMQGVLLELGIYNGTAELVFKGSDGIGVISDTLEDLKAIYFITMQPQENTTFHTWRQK